MILDNKAAHIQASPFVYTQEKENGLYSLEAHLLTLEAVDPATVVILPDEVEIVEGDEITEELLLMALPFSSFERATREQAAADALGLLLRTSVAEGAVSDEELLRIAPALTDREWRPELNVIEGDVYCCDGLLYRCVQAHTTQADWRPNLLLALWRRVQPKAAVMLWQENTDYATGDVVGYPDEMVLYTCVQGHTSQVGWEPPNIPALWKKNEDA